MLEAVEIGDGKRAVGDGRGAGDGQRCGDRVAMRAADRFGNGDVFVAARFEVARHVDDPEVYPVAGDDADQKSGRRVQVTDGEKRRAERPEAANPDRQRHREKRAHAHEEREYHREDPGHAPETNVLEIALHRAVLFGTGDQVAGETELERRIGNRRLLFVYDFLDLFL